MEGLERLELEISKMNNANITAIFEYLKTRTELYDYFNNAEKTIKQMYKFIYDKAEKQRIGNVAMINDKMVYLWAVTYFSRSNKDLGLENKKITPPADKKEDEKAEEQTDQEAKPKDETNSDQITLFQEVQK